LAADKVGPDRTFQIREAVAWTSNQAPLSPSSDFCFPPSTEQDRFVQPGPPRFGRRHPSKKYQMTTAITNNQTQCMSVSFDDSQ
jgi:hypothetical protein